MLLNILRVNAHNIESFSSHKRMCVRKLFTQNIACAVSEDQVAGTSIQIQPVSRCITASTSDTSVPYLIRPGAILGS